MKVGMSLLFGLIIAVYSSGITAQKECENATEADIVFLVDGSTNIGSTNFQEVRTFIRRIVKSLNIGPKKVRIGLAQYSDETHEEFLLNEHMSEQKLLNAVEKIPYRRGGTKTGEALNYLREKYFRKDTGSRADSQVPQIAVVISGEASTDDVLEPAKLLRKHGVVVFGIGVGETNIEQFASIANKPSKHFFHPIDNYRQLHELDSFLQNLCSTMERQKQALAETFGDIFFLVDSGIAHGQLSLFKRDLAKLINQLNAGSTYRIGLAQYGQGTNVEFYLNGHTTKQGILNAVKVFRLNQQRNQQRNLGSALQYAKTHFFTREVGGRAEQGTPQSLVVVSGKSSDDFVSRAAEGIKSMGITVYGMSGGASMADLDLFVSDKYAFGSPSVLLLKEYFLNKTEEKTTEDCRTANLADVVFIVDDSGSIGNDNFQLMRSFLHSIVSSLDVSPDKVRVAIVTYNDRSTAQFYLNTFLVESEILQFIKMLPYNGGGTNTGAALNFTLQQIFVEERGCRQNKGVQQVAVVITDGESQDSVKEAAAILRRANVTIYSVGIANANETELVVMASHPRSRHVFNVKRFLDLKPLKHILQKILCENIIDKATTPEEDKDNKKACGQKEEADIYLLMDDSGSIGNDDFKDMTNFIIKFLQTFRIGSEYVRMGLVKYADEPTLEFNLKTTSDAMALQKSIEGIQHEGGGTETGKALKFMGQYFEEAMESRDHKVPEYLIVITDGESTDEVKVPAENLRTQGVIIYTIGVKESNKTQLEEISGDHVRTFYVNDFDALKLINPTIITDICSPDVCSNIQGDIVFLTESSVSISTEDFEKMKEFMKVIISKIDIGQNQVHVGVMQFDSKQYLRFPLNRHYSRDDIITAIDEMQQKGEGRLTGKALTEASEYFDRVRGGRSDMDQRLVVITNGDAKDEIDGPAKALKEKGVLVYAIGLENAYKTQLEKISSSRDRIYVGEDFDSLKDLGRKVVKRICKKDCHLEIADFIFLVDNSRSISPEQYKSRQKFMESIVKQTTVGKDNTRFGLISYSSQIKSHFTLNKYYSAHKVIAAIQTMKPSEGATPTHTALRYSLQFFNSGYGGRTGLNVPQILMVITDRAANFPSELRESSDALRKNNVIVVSVGVKEAKRDELETMAGGEASRVFYEDDFAGLETLPNHMPSVFCIKPICKKADLVLLLDRSGSITMDGYEIMKEFTKDVVNSFEISEEFTHVGIAQFSEDPQHEFYLNSYFTKEECIDRITGMAYRGGETNIGKALKHIKHYFEESWGSRPDTPKNLVVISDGNSDDDVENAADRLRELGIEIFAIAIGDVRILQLLKITGTPQRVLNVGNINNLPAIKQKLIDELCDDPSPPPPPTPPPPPPPNITTTPGPPPPTVCKKFDLVLLLDRSGTIEDYDTMKEFTLNITDTLEISKEFTHVGIAQFAAIPKHEFYLNKYFTKKECMDHIKRMVHIGGNTYIGKALEHIKHYFEESWGSRPDTPKNLVVISDGKTHDDVEVAADRLRELGIEIFAIGIGDVLMVELLKIAGTPQRVFNVGNINNLPAIKQKLIDKLCDDPSTPTATPTPKPPPPNITTTPGPPPPTGCSIDIAMGFDISQRIGTPGEMLSSGHAKLKTFLPNIVNSVSVVQDLCCLPSKSVKTKIAFQVLRNDGSYLYDTNFEDYNNDVVNKVLRQTMSEPTYFNTALLNSFKDRFKKRSEALVKVVVIFSDGLDEDIAKLRQESDRLRQSGISALLIVALEGARDPFQLQDLEFGRGFGYKLPLSIGMQSVSSAILKQIDSVSNRECCNVTCKCSGHEGPRGFPGLPGSKGPPGGKGQPGFPGDEGVAGERGPPGPSGSQGIEGCPGPRGQKGYRGVSGSRGEDGEDALEGINGEQGRAGSEGARGERGGSGQPGIPGIRGEVGLKGQRGLRGDPGEPGADNTIPGAKGDPGNPGLPGLSGVDGESGVDGDGGNLGPNGRRGSVGEKSASGDPGDQGLPGSPGASGPQGNRGGNGGRGPNGISGFPGPQGKPGLTGDPGSAGLRGANGQKGQPGVPGVKGLTGSLGPRGMPGQDGRDGYGPEGPKGPKGESGFPGHPGLRGEDGLQGSKGFPGQKGSEGQRGNSGGPGSSGVPGEPGHPGHRGPRGPPGTKDLSECQLISYVRDNCACYHGASECPAYPTELVFGLDMSEDATPTAFERQRSALLTLLEDITISESNCPTGARVAVVGYSTYTKYLIRFQDYRRKTQLIESVKNIGLERTSQPGHLGAAMRFVGQNVFKRVRAGILMRKVAVFFSNGPRQNVTDIVTAVMEYRALNIVPAVVSLKSAPAISGALEVDDSGSSIFTVLERNVAADLSKVKNCAVCYDPCRRLEQCNFIQHPLQPQEVDVDLVMVLDSSREMPANEYTGAQQLLRSVVEQLVVSPQPRRASNQARVAVVQQSGTRDIKAEFGLGAYTTNNLMRRHLIQNMTQQDGSSALGQTLEFILKEVLRKAGQPRKGKVLLTVVGTQTAYEDRAKLRYISQKAKCEGVALFVVTVGERYDRTQVEELASLPVQQHLIHLGSLNAEEQGYAQRFFRVFLSTLSKGKNTYPPPSIKRTCNQLTEPEVFNVQDGQEPADQGDKFVVARGGQRQSGQIDTIDILTGEDGQSFITAADDPDILTPPETTSSVPKETCLLSQDAGGCHNYTAVWFFDNDKGRCARFWYGGCGGNENRFETYNECEKLCMTKTRLRGGGPGPGHGHGPGPGHGPGHGPGPGRRTIAGRRRRLTKAAALH